LLSVFDQAGVAGLRKLRGQFAAAIFDTETGLVTLMRDPSGITPLYYTLTDGKVSFASQASWLGLLANGAPRDLNKLEIEAHRQWESLGYVSGQQTLLAGVREVAPGAVMQFDLTGKLLNEASIGLPARGLKEASTPSDSVRNSIQQATARNLNADIEPYLLFSGGLDSTLLLHCMVNEGVRPRLIALQYSGGENDAELSHALRVARYYGCELEMTQFKRLDSRELQDLFLNRVDWPLDGGSLLPKVALADYLRDRDCTVVMGGSGADELFGGYQRHQARLAMSTEGVLGSLDAELNYYRSWIGKFGDSEGAFDRFLEARSNDAYADPAFVYDLLELSQFHNPRLDSCFANVGLEYRPVFQDQDIVALAASMTLSEKSELGNPKKILRDAFRREMKPEFIDVPKSPLRFAEMGPFPAWRQSIFNAWSSARSMASA